MKRLLLAGKRFVSLFVFAQLYEIKRFENTLSEHLPTSKSIIEG